MCNGTGASAGERMTGRTSLQNRIMGEGRVTSEHVNGVDKQISTLERRATQIDNTPNGITDNQAVTFGNRAERLHDAVKDMSKSPGATQFSDQLREMTTRLNDASAKVDNNVNPLLTVGRDLARMRGR